MSDNNSNDGRVFTNAQIDIAPGKGPSDANLTFGGAANAGVRGNVNQMVHSIGGADVLTVNSSGITAPNLTSALKNRNIQLCGSYDFSTQGGVQGAIPIKDRDGNSLVVPAGYIINSVEQLVKTSVLSGGSATVSLGYSGAVAALVGATAKATLVANYKAAGAVDGTVANQLVNTIDRTINVTIAAADLTAGKIVYFIELILNDLF